METLVVHAVLDHTVLREFPCLLPVLQESTVRIILAKTVVIVMPGTTAYKVVTPLDLAEKRTYTAQSVINAHLVIIVPQELKRHCLASQVLGRMLLEQFRTPLVSYAELVLCVQVPASMNL